MKLLQEQAKASWHKQTAVWDFGYDAEVGKAWRREQGGSRKAPKEWCDDIIAKEGRSQWQPSTAKWKDGCQHDIATLCIIDLENRSKGQPAPKLAKRQKSEAKVNDKQLFVGNHENGEKVRVARRSQGDRGEIVAATTKKAGGKEVMLCMVTLKACKNDASAAAELMTKIASDYVTGTLKKADVYSARETLLKDLHERGSQKIRHGRSSASTDTAPQTAEQSASADAAEEPEDSDEGEEEEEEPEEEEECEEDEQVE
jgi:hypothetical protein